MSETLYRKYRPKFFKELVGQEHVKITLLNEIKNNRITHAYLFTGPRGVGKTTTARLLAKAVNCRNYKGAEPCNSCDACLDIIKGRALDLIEIDAASHTQVDHVRENIIPNAQTAPTRSKYKVFIIDEVHMLSTSAFNALLKILEEPPSHVIFILATTEVHKLPETIISRCQRFDFKRIHVGDIIKRLSYISDQEKIKVEEKVLRDISVLSEGSIRDAESLLGQLFSLGEKKITNEIADLVLPRSDINLIFQLFSHLVAKNAKASIELLNKLIEEGVDLKYFVNHFIEFLRKAILLKIGSEFKDHSLFEISKDLEKEIQKIIAEISLKDLRDMIDSFVRYKKDIFLTSVPQLPLEMAVIELCYDDSDEDKSGLDQADKPKMNKQENNPVRKDSRPKEIKNHSDFKAIEDKWSGIVKYLNKNNHALALILKNCQPISYDSEYLTVGCNFKFYQERLNAKKNLEIIEKVIEEIMKKKIRIKFVVEKQSLNKKFKDTPSNREDSLYAQVLESFGEEIAQG